MRFTQNATLSCFYLLISSLIAKSISISSNFVLGVPGSVSAGSSVVCALEYKHGIRLGGYARCFPESKVQPPKELAGGSRFTCGVAIDSTVHCWGNIPDLDIPGYYTQISVYGFIGCGIQTDGKINCWGSSQLVRRVLRGQESRKYVQISCGATQCCAVDDKAFPHCWSDSNATDLPRHDPSDTEVFLALNGDIGNKFNSENDDNEYIDEDNKSSVTDYEKIQFSQVSVGADCSCGITYQGQHMLCWGRCLAIKKDFPRFEKGPFKQVSVGGGGVCAIRSSNDDDGERIESNALHCWSTTKMLMPEGLPLEIDQVVVGDLLSCLVSMDSELRCWGRSFVKDIPTAFVVA